MLQKAMENFHLQTAKEVFQSTQELTVQNQGNQSFNTAYDRQKYVQE